MPIAIGLVIFLTGGGGWFQTHLSDSGILGEGLNLIYDILTVLKNIVAPASMMVIGAKLADINFKGIFKDKYLCPFIALRLLVFPAIMWAIMRVCLIFGIIESTPMAIVLILCSTPAAALTSMFAELYDCDAVYAGKLVAITTVLSVASMPTVALLLQI